MAKAGRKPKNNHDDVEAVIIKRDSKEYISSAYSSEKELEDEICNNIKAFCINILGDNYISHRRQHAINGRKGGAKRRSYGLLTIDLIIKCEREEYLVEIKKPKYQSENRAAIGQVLNYGRYFPNHKLVICTTSIDPDTAETIGFYNLPIKYVFLDKGRSAEYKKEVDKCQTYA